MKFARQAAPAPREILQQKWDRHDHGRNEDATGEQVLPTAKNALVIASGGISKQKKKELRVTVHLSHVCTGGACARVGCPTALLAPVSCSQ
jgi:hypothetical protein